MFAPRTSTRFRTCDKSSRATKDFRIQAVPVPSSRRLTVGRSSFVGICTTRFSSHHQVRPINFASFVMACPVVSPLKDMRDTSGSLREKLFDDTVIRCCAAVSIFCSITLALTLVYTSVTNCRSSNSVKSTAVISHTL